MKFVARFQTGILQLSVGALLLLALHASDVRAQIVNPDTPEASQSGSQRQKDIQKDTDKLLELATELKQYVDKTNEDILSMDVIKKADEIEKLAHSVREKMKGM